MKYLFVHPDKLAEVDRAVEIAGKNWPGEEVKIVRLSHADLVPLQMITRSSGNDFWNPEHFFILDEQAYKNLRGPEITLKATESSASSE